MSPFTDDERIQFSDWNDIERDGDGREHLVGLTFDETVEYMEYSRDMFNPRRDRNRAQRKRYLELSNKYHIARLRKLGYEIMLRNATTKG